MNVPDRIETERLVLRRLMPPDEAVFVDFMTGPANTTRFMFVDSQKTTPGARAFLHSITDSYATAAPYFVLAITRRDLRDFVGLCGISNLPGDRVFDCFCCLRPAARRAGYASEAIRGLADYCFRHDIVGEFHLYIDPRNNDSLRLAERLHCECRGPAPHPVNGERCVWYVVRASSTRA